MSIIGLCLVRAFNIQTRWFLIASVKECHFCTSSPTGAVSFSNSGACHVKSIGLCCCITWFLSPPMIRLWFHSMSCMDMTSVSGMFNRPLLAPFFFILIHGCNQSRVVTRNPKLWHPLSAHAHAQESHCPCVERTHAQLTTSTHHVHRVQAVLLYIGATEFWAE